MNGINTIKMQEELQELHSKVEWYEKFVDYIYKNNKQMCNDACDYADKK
jgi:transcription elongation factor Elf1